MTIHIEDLSFEVIIGLLDFERDRPQRVIINLEATYDYKNDQFIDYADMVVLIKDKLKLERYTLLENALLGIKETLYTAYPHLETLSIKISKPDILADCTVSLSKTWNY